MIKRSILLVITLTSIGFINQSYGQCLENLRRARTVYDEGRLHEILDVIGEECLTNNTLNEEEKSEAYRLLILSYIYQDLPDKADAAMLALLQTNPRFKIDRTTDPNELINLYDSFRTDPIFRLGVKVTLNTSPINISNAYSVNNTFEANGGHSNNLAFTVSGFIEKDFIDNKLTLRAEPHFSLHKMTYTASGFPLDEDPTTMTTTWKDIEIQSWLGVNLLARYGVLKNWTVGKKNRNIGKKINPHLILGPSIQYLMSSSLSATTDIFEGESASGADLNLIEEQIRKRINLSGIIGVGFVFNLKKVALFTDITYHHGFVNITDKHTSPELTFRYGRSMSDMNLSSINISGGIMLNKYSPKKLTN